MRKSKSLLVVSEESWITKIINSLKRILKIKQDKEEVVNRTAIVLTEEKIERRIKNNISDIEEKVIKDISYVDNLNEEELNYLDEMYDIKINELESILNDKKSKYYKLASAKKII